MTDRRLLTPEEAAALLGVSKKSIYGFVKSGQLIASRIGRHLRIRESDIDDFINERRTGAPPKIIPGSSRPRRASTTWTPAPFRLREDVS